VIRSEVITARVTSGGLELVKWFALACMVVDHANAVFFARELPLWAEIAGRLAFPLFALVFAFNLARPGADLWRVGSRLVLAGAIAQPMHGLAFGTLYALWPLNIMFLFAGFVGMVALLERERVFAAFVLGLALAFLVEYSAAGVLLCLTAWAHFRRPSTETAIAVLVSLAGLCLLNGNAHALWALPVFAVMVRAPVDLPRARWAFYAFYPAHLAALVVMR
jgi:hypothetical protein